MASTPNLAGAIPQPSAPICDPDTGILTNVWLRYLLNQYARTGGALGPAQSPADVSAALARLAAEVADLQVLAAFADVGEAAAAPAALPANVMLFDGAAMLFDNQIMTFAGTAAPATAMLFAGAAMLFDGQTMTFGV